MRHKYSYEEVKAVAMKYNSVKDFYTNANSFYQISSRNGWIKSFDWLKQDKVFSGRKNTRGHSFEEVKEVAMQYQTRNDFAKGNSTLYQYAVNHHWLDLFDWMPLNNDLSEEDIFNIAKQYDNIEDFIKEREYVYKISKYRKFRFPWMTVRKGEHVSYETIKNIADNYISKRQFSKECPLEYCYCEYQEILGKLFKDDCNISYLDKDKCYNIAYNFNNRTEFRISYNNLFNYANVQGWIDEWFGNDRGKKKYAHDFEQIFDIPEDTSNIYCAHSNNFPELGVLYFKTDNFNFNKFAIRSYFATKNKVKGKFVSVCTYNYYIKKYE